VIHASRWESFVWPRWLPEQARLPLIAQITGAVALTALIVGPWWSSIPEPAIVPASTFVDPAVLTPLAPVVTPTPASTRLDAATRSAVARPAHLNLDVRHTFKNVELAVTVDGKPALTTQLDGSGKRFKMFGKRAERGFTQTIDLAPGVRVVRVRMKSAAEKFDQTRVERFDLAAASVATIRIAADKSGLSLVANHPPPPPAPKPPVVETKPPVPTSTPAAVPAAAAVTTAPPAAAPAVMRASQAESTMLELVQSLRSMLIAIAGFVASAATGFVVQEFLRRRRGLLFAEAEAPPPAEATPERRRRRRAGF
jgi:hypothetical protein